MAADNKKAIKRYRMIIILISLAGLYILGTALSTMLVHADYWRQVSQRFVSDSISVEATRGNIISADGRVMVASLPQYRLFMDYIVIDKDSAAREKAQHWRDSALIADADSIAEGLHRIFPDRSVEWFHDRLLKGRERRSHAWNLYPRLASYIQYKQCKELPLLRETPFKGGFNPERIMLRKKPYGSLASRTLGDVVKDSVSDTIRATSGLEWCYDSILRGKNGIKHRSKVRDRMVSFYDREPVSGHDLVSTIDVTMQDIAEKALVSKLREPDVHGEKGVVILMEVATGDIKALVSMTRYIDPVTGKAEYYEAQNDAINALWEPGSTFKTGSIMVALEDGYITPDDSIDCCGGVYMMHGRPMKDHNWHRGGYGVLSVSNILEQSSNIGVSRIIDRYYHDCPEKYVQGLYNLGVGVSLGMPMGVNPWVRMPNDPKYYWSKTTLPWMSIGYETMLPPISTLAFYNAIANNGRMVRPRFAKAEMVNGQVVREFPVVTLKERICSPHTLRDIRTILFRVVHDGLGRKAGNKRFNVSGKTGTAQVAKNGSYASHSYMISFCGYFPSEEPKYSCIVCIRKDGLPASGGGQCGPVFSQISQLVMSQGVYRDPREVADSLSVFKPEVARERTTVAEGVVPDVVGMGARDAVYCMQQAGLRVKIRGTGLVQEQSIPADTPKMKGKTVTLKLK